MWGAITQDVRRASPDAVFSAAHVCKFHQQGSFLTFPVHYAPNLRFVPCKYADRCKKPARDGAGKRTQRYEYIPQVPFRSRMGQSSRLLSKQIPVIDRLQPASEPPELPIPQTWRLTLSYDGTDFHGWQVQPGLRTVQGELQAALCRVTGEGPLPQGCGRTDTGVHALGQVASFQLAARIPTQNLLRALNRTLPEAIRVLDARLVAPDFHARHSAVAKNYEYRVFRGAVCPPFLSRYVYACRWPYDIGALQAAAQQILGEHDFLSFAATDPDLAWRTAADDSLPQRSNRPDGPAVRRIFFSEWIEQESSEGRLLLYRVKGNGFLHHMVRNLVGTMLDVGRGYRRVEEIPLILAARNRAAAGPTAPACGLFLHSVEYAEEPESSDLG